MQWSAAEVAALLIKLLRRASSVLDCPLDSIEVVGERRMLAKLTSIMDNIFPPAPDCGSLEQLFQQQTLTPTV